MQPTRIRFAVLAVLSLALFAAALLISGAQQLAPMGDPHASGKIVVPPNTSEIAYCMGCHNKGCPLPHPESVTPSWPARGKTVMGVAGEITCGTCHTRGFRHRTDAFLARDQKGLCNNCHYGNHALTNTHTTNQNCEGCHIKGQAALTKAPPAEAKALKPGMDDECSRCHYDGPVTHPIGILNKKKKAKDLPLSPEGNITCVTCHVGHKQQDRFGMMLRKDNRRGGLCNSCHDDL